MNRTSKSFAVFIILIIVVSSLSLITVKSASSQTPTDTPSPTPSPTPTASPSPSPSPPSSPPPSSLRYTTPTFVATPTPLPTPPPTPDVSSIFKPSVPEFTLYLVNHPIDFPPTTPNYTTDPYTGETKLQNSGSSGYRIDNWTIELWIPNRQFNYPNDGSNKFHLYYDVRTKGYFEQSWRELYSPFHGLHSGNYSDSGTFITCPAQSSNVYTIITYSAYSPPYYSYPQETYPPNAQVDFQVSAVLGHDSTIFYDDHPLAYPMLIGHQEPAIAYDIQSDWSNTQTITISNSSLSTATPQNPVVSTSFSIPIPVNLQNSTPTSTSSLTPTQTPTPTVPEFPVLVILPFFVSVLFVAVYFKHRRTNHE